MNALIHEHRLCTGAFLLYKYIINSMYYQPLNSRDYSNSGCSIIPMRRGISMGDKCSGVFFNKGLLFACISSLVILYGIVVQSLPQYYSKISFMGGRDANLINIKTSQLNIK